MDELEDEVRGRDSNLAPNQFHSLSDDASHPLESDSSSGIAPEVDVANCSVAAVLTCQRCGKSVPGDLAKCPFCAARLSRPAVPHDEALVLQTAPIHPCNLSDPDETTALITRLLLLYLVLLATNLIGHGIAFTIFDARLSEKSLVNLDIVFTACFELFDTAIVLIAFFKIPVIRLPAPDGLMRQLGWLAGPFILAICLGLNFGYHILLQDYLQFPNWARHHLHLPVQWAILFVCIQPGIVEELFFRYVALGTLSRVMGLTAAVCVTSVMFGMAHSAVLLSIPILTVVGLGLGIVRVWSGSIILPMLLHALHNAVVIYFETRR